MNRWHFPLMAVVVAVLSLGLWAGLVRLGWALPSIKPAAHGPLMIGGFLGTLISLERAVAFRLRWPYAAPACSAVAALLLLLLEPLWPAQILITIASAMYLAAFALAYHRHFGGRWEWASVTMIAGAACWLVGNGLWLGGRPLTQASLWWVAFLLLTIAGERLELARVQLAHRSSLTVFVVCTGLFGIGLGLALWRFDLGLRAAGLGLAALGLWLLRFDVAGRTIRATGLARFIAACLLPGYVWLVAAGALWLAYAPYFAGGPYYDAMLHMILVGFVFSMIFGHAPIIVPALVGIPVLYAPRFYAHLVLLHLSLILRVWGDLAGSPLLRQWGGMFNVIAITGFIVNMAVSIRAAATTRGPYTQ